MRIISQDGTRDFPYEKTSLLLRHRIINENDIFVIVAIFYGIEYDMAYYHSDELAYNVLEYIRNSPEYVEEEIPCDDWFFNDIEEYEDCLDEEYEDINDEDTDDTDDEDVDNENYSINYTSMRKINYIILPPDQENYNGKKS